MFTTVSTFQLERKSKKRTGFNSNEAFIYLTDNYLEFITVSQNNTAIYVGVRLA